MLSDHVVCGQHATNDLQLLCRSRGHRVGPHSSRVRLVVLPRTLGLQFVPHPPCKSMDVGFANGFDLIVRMRSLIALNYGSESVVCKITTFRPELHDTAIIGVVPKPLDSTDPHLSEG